MNLRSRWLSLLSLYLCFAGPAVTLAGKPKPDPLERMDPVPANEPIPTIDFFRAPLFSRPELNPAGTHFAALVSTTEDRIDTAIFDLTTQRLDRVTAGDDMDTAQFGWLNDSRLWFSVTKRKLYAFGLYTAELGQLGKAYPLESYSVVETIGFPRNNPLHLILWVRHSATEAGADGGVVKIDVRRDLTYTTGPLRAAMTSRIVRRYATPSPGTPIAYLSDSQGELAYAVTVKDGLRTLFSLRGDRWVPSPVDLEEIDVVDRSDRPDELLALGPRAEGKPRELRRLDVLTGTLGEVVLTDPDYDLAGVHIHRDPVTDRILGATYDRKGPQTVWLDPTWRAIQEGVQAIFPDQIIRILGSDDGANRCFFVAESDRSPATYYIFDKVHTQVSQITNTAPWIDPARMLPMKLISYKARDGKKIEGYLTLPAGTSKESPAPLVVLPHGGPWARDSWHWDREAQFLGSRGYAVFQPNYRGSTGTTWRFPEDDEWAFRKMHEDVTDGVGALIKTGLIAPDRIAIMGGSFGGYLAVCGVAFEPKLYRCAVTIAGVFDWEKVIKESRGNEYQRGDYGVLRRRLGDPKSEIEAFEAISPLRSVAEIKVPVFVAHGTEDPVASIAQSRRLIGELKKHKVPFEVQIEGDEGHGFRKLDDRVKLYERVEAFLRKHLGPGSAAR